MSGSLTCGGGENVPGISAACATLSFTYPVRGPCSIVILKLWRCRRNAFLNFKLNISSLEHLQVHSNGLMQDWSTSSALTIKILQSCTKPSIWRSRFYSHSTHDDSDTASVPLKLRQWDVANIWHQHLWQISWISTNFPFVKTALLSKREWNIFENKFVRLPLKYSPIYPDITCSITMTAAEHNQPLN